MSARSGFLLFLSLVLASTASGCDQSQATIPTAQAPVPGSASLAGAVPSAAQRWRGQDVTIYAAPYYEDGSGEGFFLLEPNLHPRADVQRRGVFSMVDVPPGQYVLVAGPTPEEAQLVIGADGEAVIFTFLPDEAAALGVLALAD